MGLVYSFADYRSAGGEKQIESLLQEFTEPIVGMYLYYPQEYSSVKLLRLFIDHIQWSGCCKVPAFHRLGAIALGTVSPRIRQSVSRSCRAIGYPPQGYSAPHYGRLHLLLNVGLSRLSHHWAGVTPSRLLNPTRTTPLRKKPFCCVPPCAAGVCIGTPRVCLGPPRGGPQRTTTSLSTNPRLRRSYSLWRGRFLGQLF